MSLVAELIIVVGALLSVLAAIGLHRFSSTYARLHAAGKASPVGFAVVAIGAGIELGWVGGARLAVAAAALMFTLPVAVHLLFRAVHHTSAAPAVADDDLAAARSTHTVTKEVDDS